MSSVDKVNRERAAVAVDGLRRRDGCLPLHLGGPPSHLV